MQLIERIKQAVTVESVVSQHVRLRRSGATLVGLCPFHDDKNTPSLTLYSEERRWHCFGCNVGGDVLDFYQRIEGHPDALSAAKALAAVHGISEEDGAKPQVVAEYTYTDAHGKMLFQTVRREPGANGARKDFRQRRPGPDGQWIWNLDGVRRVLYRLPEVVKATSVVVVEGEKCADAVAGLGITATCNPMGAGKWDDALSKDLAEKGVVVIPDHDEPGQKHARDVVRSLLRAGAGVRMVDLPGLAAKEDVADWIARGGTREQLVALINATDDETEPPPEPERSPAVGRLPVSEGNSQWLDPLPLHSELPPVEAFSEDLLPDLFRPLVRDVAERMQVPVDYPAVVMVLCLAGAVNRRAVIRPKANDTSWLVVPNLWGGIVAPPGFMKSPVIQAVTRPLVQIQTEWRNQYEGEAAEHARLIEEKELEKSAWKKKFKACKETGDSAPERPPEAPESPKLRRLIVNDATFEALHQTMSENPAGILLIRDELTGWWSQLDREGREGERPFCLQAWNGDTGYTIDRVGRGTIHVEHCCMSMLGGIQPGRLRSYLVEALRDGPSNDGLIQRFQLLVWPDTRPDWKYVDRDPDVVAGQQAEWVFRKLVALDPENPARFHFAPDAQKLFMEWLAENAAKVRGGELPPALASHLSKYPKLMPALALLFEVAEWAAGSGSADTVSLEHTRKAAAWCGHLESHARRLYSCVVSPQVRAARELAEKIKKRQVGADGFFSCRDVYLKGWTGLDSPEAVRLATQVLQDARWIRELPEESRPSGGRPSSRYAVNPKVWK